MKNNKLIRIIWVLIFLLDKFNLSNINDLEARLHNLKKNI